MGAVIPQGRIIFFLVPRIEVRSGRWVTETSTEVRPGDGRSRRAAGLLGTCAEEGVLIKSHGRWVRPVGLNFRQGRIIIEAGMSTGSGKSPEVMAIGIFSCLLKGIVWPLNGKEDDANAKNNEN